MAGDHRIYFGALGPRSSASTSKPRALQSYFGVRALRGPFEALLVWLCSPKSLYGWYSKLWSPFWVPQIILGTQKGTVILTTTHMTLGAERPQLNGLLIQVPGLSELPKAPCQKEDVQTRVPSRPLAMLSWEPLAYHHGIN